MANPLYRDYEKLVEISVQGKKFKVPEKNTLLRAFQYISPDTIPYGRFCWNQECQLCRVTYRLNGDMQENTRGVLSCKVLVSEGMEIVELTDELKWTLSRVLRASMPRPPSD